MHETPGSALATTNQQPLALTDYAANLTFDRFRDNYLPGCKDEADVRLCFEVMRHTGLSPILKQIYFIPRTEWSKENGSVTKIVPQTSIDGLRLIAERSGKRDGEMPPEWCGEDGRWKQLWLADHPPAAARVGVCKRGCTQPFYGVALFKEYVQRTKDGKITKFWNEKPALMLAKCAEALAIRKAFPQETAGLYAQEELPPEATPKAKPAQTEAGARFIQFAKQKFGADKKAFSAWIAANFEGKSYAQLSDADMHAGGDLLETELARPEAEEAEWTETQAEPEAQPETEDHAFEQRRFFAVLKDKGLEGHYEGAVCWWAGETCGWANGKKGRPSLSASEPQNVRLASNMLSEMEADDIARLLDDYRCHVDDERNRNS